jgi:ribosome-associated toxin RatA of RatAB toxin-antitoxin module
MREVELEAKVDGISAEDLYEVVRDFGRYPELTEGVHSVEVEGIDGTRSRSRWEVAFRDGVLKWVEEDEFFDRERRIEFEQTEGDMVSFGGTWRILDDADGGSTVNMKASFDLGMASLDSLVEPIAERVLRENFATMLDGLTGGRSRVSEPPAAPAEEGS